VEASKASQAGYTLDKRCPVVVKDLRRETRFSAPPLLKDHGVVSGVSVPMIYGEEVYGVLGVHTRSYREFTESEINFLQAIANTVTMAVARREAEEKLHRYAVELERSNRLKELFTDIMRHDLHNPLAVIKGISELLSEEDASEEVTLGLRTINRNATRVLRMIDDASKLAKLGSADGLVFDRKDLWEIMENVVSNLRFRTDEKEMRVVLENKGECYADVHPSIEDVFDNIVSNAVKYGPKKSQITIGIKDSGDCWLVSVKDTGEGVPDEYKEVIFNRFTRMPKKGVKGTGLGLAIAKRVVELHRGKVWVEDNPSGGSVFCVEIPKSNRRNQ
jgi:hypothetical protein